VVPYKHDVFTGHAIINWLEVAQVTNHFFWVSEIERSPLKMAAIKYGVTISVIIAGLYTAQCSPTMMLANDSYGLGALI
jgi:hypothetical protein